MEEKPITEIESFQIIQQMIDRAKGSVIEKGTWAIYWGTLITFCSMATYFAIRFNIHLPFDIFLITIPAMVIQIGTIIYQKRKNRKKPKSIGQCQKAIKLIWLAFTISILLVAFAPNGVPTIVFFVLYGIPTFVTGALIDFKPLTIGGIVCWVCAIAFIFFRFSSATNLLLVAICATFAWLIPGIIMRRRYLRWKKNGNV